jgi:very-short-patch-repair endonuclease
MESVSNMTPSDLEELLLFQIKSVGLPEPEREYMFALEAMGRRWRFDFAYPEQMIGIEVEGGVWVRGRHTRGSGFIADCEKYNEAAILGWTVLRFPGDAIESGEAINMIEKVLGRN